MYSFQMTTRIEFGVGAVRSLPDWMRQMKLRNRVMVVSDPGVVQAGIITPVIDSLENSGFFVTLFTEVAQNPRDNDCLLGVKAFLSFGAESVLAIGGGSAMDTAKAIALIAKCGGEPSDYVDGKLTYGDAFPIICVPTTAGTGSEVTRSSVITEADTHRKMTLKDNIIRPKLAVLDPELTLTVPRSVTAATGVDALVHAIEGYTCTLSSPITRSFGVQAMRAIVQALPDAFTDGSNVAARSDMLEGSLLAGLCFGNADVAAVHCLAEALGGLYDTPHGVANAIFLPHVLRYNAGGNEQMHAHLARIMKFASASDPDNFAVEKLCQGIEGWTRNLQIPTLHDLSYVKQGDFEKIVDLAFANGSTPSNVRPIGKPEYRNILENAFRQTR